MKDMQEMTFKETLKDFPRRILNFIWKLFSIKVIIMVGAFVLIAIDKVEGWHAVILFLFTALIVIFGRESIKFIEALKGLK
ncbi:MAG: hypothetical protein GY804_04485 [Alphaproteobacteria bacterium]|nr:hypothetical protein [Alphaproteobacteria bacterium]MCP4393508.1 hypothetical protein [Alphaproteobacteria bacterium]